jgi:anti-sigma regulatory factor (Ser/Thr protein kinase)
VGVQDTEDYGNRSVMPYRALILRPDVEAPSLARKAVLGWLQDVGLEDLAERLLLIASELVANATVHAHTVLEISMSITPRNVKLGVRDGDLHLPRLGSANVPGARPGGPAPYLTESGRGLAIVDGLADEWGVDVLRGGKRIWARVSVSRRQ